MIILALCDIGYACVCSNSNIQTFNYAQLCVYIEFIQDVCLSSSHLQEKLLDEAVTITMSRDVSEHVTPLSSDSARVWIMRSVKTGGLVLFILIVFRIERRVQPEPEVCVGWHRWWWWTGLASEALLDAPRRANAMSCLAAAHSGWGSH